jgi:hypothetical protein
MTTPPLTYAQVYDWDNLYLAWRNAAKGKRGRAAAARFEYHLEENLFTLQEELAARAYRPGPYTSFTIHEPKRRLTRAPALRSGARAGVSAAPFRDRVVHHALCNVIEPVFERAFIADSYANRAGKGTHRALDRCQRFARRYRYVLPCDIAQYFPSIDHAILEGTLRRKLRDPGLVWLARQILDSGIGVLRNEYEMVYFPGDDLFAVDRPRGLPTPARAPDEALRSEATGGRIAGARVGNLTYQFWANCYLTPFDYFVHCELRCPAYLRYVDDFLLFGDDKRQIWAWKEAIIGRLASLRLTIHLARAQVRPVAEGIPFLGFVVFPQERRLKRRKGVAFQRRLRSIAQLYAEGKLPRERMIASLKGWLNHVRYANTTGLRRSVVRSVQLRAPAPPHQIIAK